MFSEQQDARGNKHRRLNKRQNEARQNKRQQYSRAKANCRYSKRFAKSDLTHRANPPYAISIRVYAPCPPFDTVCFSYSFSFKNF